MGLGNYSQSNETRRLSGITEQRGSQTGTSTLVMCVFGFPFFGIGVFVVLLGLKIVPSKASSTQVPDFIPVAFGLVFGLAGLMVWTMAWRQFRANRRRQQASERHISEPALADYKWDPRGFHSHCWAKTTKSICAVGFLALFLSMFNWWAWGAHGPWLVKIIVSLFDLILAYACWQTLLTFSRALRFGNSHIEFAHFPYRTNESILIRWLIPPGIARANKGSFVLRCVREFYETTGSGKSRSRQIVHEEHWSGTWSFENPEDFLPGKNIELEFEPAAGLPATSLSGRETVYWELEVNLCLPGPDFKEAYLVPVY
jgi:hypothetical protein